MPDKPILKIEINLYDYNMPTELPEDVDVRFYALAVIKSALRNARFDVYALDLRCEGVEGTTV